MARCPMCDEANIPMGSLGHTSHYRCRACGWWYSLTRKPRAKQQPKPQNQPVASQRLDGKIGYR